MSTTYFIFLRFFVSQAELNPNTDLRVLIFKTVSEDLRHGIRADLETSNGICILVDIVPFQAVGPGPCVEWVVEVKGKPESVDFDKRIIRIEAKPKDWKDAWQL